jgi:hypothetical protein
MDYKSAVAPIGMLYASTAVEGPGAKKKAAEERACVNIRIKKVGALSAGQRGNSTMASHLQIPPPLWVKQMATK